MVTKVLFNKEQKEFVMFVGLPGSGKSTLRSKFEADMGKAFVSISSDDLLEVVAKANGTTYNKVFQSHIKEATQEADRALTRAILTSRNIIHDKTNVSREVRRKVLDRLPSYYKKIAVVTLTTDPDLWRARMSARIGKEIPEHVIKSMLERFTIPTEAEGFDEIIFYGD